MIAPHVVQPRNYNNEAIYNIYIYIYIWCIWSIIFHVYTSKCLCLCAAWGKKVRRQCNVFIWQAKSMLRFYAWLPAWPQTHQQLQPGVGTRSDCVDGNALIRLWQSILQLTWLGATAKKWLKNMLIKLPTVSIALSLKLFEVDIKCT